MRHHWRHPMFDEEQPAPAPDIDIHESEEWLRDFLDRRDNPLSLEQVLAAGRGEDNPAYPGWRIDDDELYVRGDDA